MMRSLNTSASGMVAQQFNLDVISNNLANVNTAGFKQQRAEFQDLMYQNLRMSSVSTGGSAASPVSLQVGLGSRFSATATNFGQGSAQATSNPMDVAINGNGFFKVLRPDGSAAYTRDGSFKVDANGLLVTSDGYPLDPPITIPPNRTSLTIDPEGVISVTLPDGANAVKIDPPISVTVFSNPSAMQRMGQNLYTANEASGEAIEGKPGQNGSGTLQAGFIEGSNVQMVEEMVRMILAQRSYEINSKAIQTSDEMLSTLNNLKR